MLSILYHFISKKIFQFSCFRQKVKIGSIGHLCGFIYIRNKGDMVIGDNIKINSGSRCNRISAETKSAIIVREFASLIIGNNVGLSNSTIVCSDKVTINDNVMIGANCKIWDTYFHNMDYTDRVFGNDKPKKEEIFIEEGVFIGYGSIILPGVRIGEKSIIGAGSVVTKSIPPNEVWAGNPAKKIR